MLLSGDYEGFRRVVYGGRFSDDGDIGEGATFVPVCEKCGRSVKADAKITFDYQGQPQGTTATCKKCGRTTMPFEGYV